MATKSRGHQCKAKTKSGKPCQAAAMAGCLCFFHANPNKAAELGRIGGRSKRRSDAGGVDQLPKLETVMAVRQVVSRLVADVYAGKLQPRVAAGMAPLLNLQLQAIKATDVEHRMAALEKELHERDKGEPK
jgi:hypothetical protein